MQRGTDKLFIPASWKQWIAENVLQGSNLEELKEILVREGFAEELASLEVDAAASHPYIEGAKSVATQLETRDWLLHALRELEATGASDAVDRRLAVACPGFLVDFFCNNRPLVLTEGITDWPALQSWTPEYFRTRWGTHLVDVGCRQSESSGDLNRRVHNQRMPLGEFIDLIQSQAPPARLRLIIERGSENQPAMSDVWSDIGSLPECLSPCQDTGRILRIESAESVTPLGYERTGTLLIQLSGRRRVMLVSPLHLPLLQNHLDRLSNIELDGVDREEIPLLRDVRTREVTIQPGEILFIPLGWWRFERALSPSISVVAFGLRAPDGKRDK